MASTPQTLLGLIALLVLSLALQMVAGRDVPALPTLHTEWLGHFDRSVLIPGIGRVMVPKKGSGHHKSFNYNPITRAPGGIGVSIPGVGGSTGGASRRSYVPGGDDTFMPNPGVEVPNPVGGGGIAAPSAP